MSHAVDVDDLEVTFGSLRAVDGASLRVAYGEVVALLGPNGAGKTTLVETLCGFRRPDGGRVRLHGLDPRRDHREVVVRTGALLQRGGVWAPMSPREVLRLSASYYEAPRDGDELLALLDLSDCQRTPWRRLSGGQQQRTLLALALLGRPRALVLDEPTTAVDPEGRQVIRDLIAAERDRGCALLITTHELTEAERVADRLVIMHLGRVLAEGTLEELAGAPEIVVETSGPLDAGPLATLLEAPVESRSPRLVRIALEATSERLAVINRYVADAGLVITSLRTRATLEEHYLDLIAQQRRGEHP